MTELCGFQYLKTEKYSLFCIHDLSDDIKGAIREQLSAICHGQDCTNSGRSLYNYKNTVKEFLRRYEVKSENIQIGMIGELLVHLILSYYFDEFKSVTPYFNMEERSIKKGYDVVLTEVNNPNLWITEVKSGKLHSNKSSNQTMNDLLGTAKRDLKERLNEENISLWLEAINGAKVSFDSNNTMKSAVINILETWGDDASDGEYSSHDKNVVLAGFLFSNLSDVITSENANIKQQQIENEQIFNQVCVLVLQKETYSKVYEFLKEEASDEE